MTARTSASCILSEGESSNSDLCFCDAHLAEDLMCMQEPSLVDSKNSSILQPGSSVAMLQHPEKKDTHCYCACRSPAWTTARTSASCSRAPAWRQRCRRAVALIQSYLSVTLIWLKTFSPRRSPAWTTARTSASCSRAPAWRRRCRRARASASTWCCWRSWASSGAPSRSPCAPSAPSFSTR